MPATVRLFLFLALVVAFSWHSGATAEEPDKKDERPPYQRLLPGDDARRAAELGKQAAQAEQAGQYPEAIAAVEELLALRRRLQGADHWQSVDQQWALDALRTIAALPADARDAFGRAEQGDREAQALQAQARYAQALPLKQKLLEARRGVLGERHPLTAQAYNSVALNLAAQGKPAEAQPLHQKALAVRSAVLGLRHPDTASSCNNLASTLSDQARHAEAEPLYHQALDICRGVLGERHPFTATSSNNLALSLSAQGRVAEAEPLLRQALAVRRAVLGDRHPLTASSYNNLAMSLNAQGKHAEAEPLLRQALGLHRAALGERHPDTARCYDYVASNLDAQGKHAEAEPLYRQALDTCRGVLGERHPLTATLGNNLGVNLNLQGKFAEAEPLLRQALAVRRAVLGDRHPVTASSYNNLAFNLNTRGRYAEAEPLYRQALDVSRAVLGEGHPNTATGLNNLASNLNAQGRHGEAEPLNRQALAVRRAALGERHPLTLASCNTLAFNLAAQGEWAEARDVWARAVQAYELARLRVGARGLDRAAFAASDSPREALAAGLARAGRAAEAWQTLEADLARGLFDEHSARLQLPAADRQQLAEADARLAALEQQQASLLADSRPLGQKQTALDELAGRRRQAEAALDEVAAALSQREVWPLARVQPHLPERTALLVWVDVRTTGGEVEEHWAGLLRRRGEPVWVRLPGTGPGGTWTWADRALPGLARTALATRDVPLASALLQRLNAQRLQPLERHLTGVERLVVLTSRWMADVPVEALSDRRTISYAPSGTRLARLARDSARPAGPATLLAVGDPVFGAKSGAVPLPGTRREVEAVARLFPRALALLGADASKARLDELHAAGELKGYRCLHFATHGQVNPEVAFSSALALAEAGGAPSRLTAAEVRTRWELDAELVTLSACDSGLGRFGGGEGLLGFSQAFFLAGARSVVLSLWKVDDTATALLMVRLYQNLLGKRDGLKAPLGKAEALREAKAWLRELTREQIDAEVKLLPRGPTRTKEKAAPIADKPFAHPHYWAAFILIGDPD